MSAASVRPTRSLAVPLSASVVLHVAIVGLALQIKAAAPMATPPVYKVHMIAAAAGAPAIGVVQPAREAEQPKAPPPRLRETKAPTPAPAQRTRAAPVRATPTPPRTQTRADRTPDQTKAGGGPTGGKGTDVANVNLDGRDFPFPTYLENIVRQIQLRFGLKAWPGAATAEFSFLILRDGSVRGLRLVSSNGASYEFKMEAQGAIEGVGRLKLFGPLPDGFADDALPVVFSFDPRILR